MRPSGKQQHHRLNCGGDRQAKGALWLIVMSRLSFDMAIQIYLERRTIAGLIKLEAMRCVKRYVARRVTRSCWRLRLDATSMCPQRG
jgi:transposase